MGAYGDEFVNAREAVREGRGEDRADFTEVFLGLLREPLPRTIYFAPWKTRPSSPSDPRWRHPPGYQIGKTPMGRAMLDRTFFPDGRVRYTLIIPEHITLWFALGAYLELGEEVAVIIRGGLRADATQSLPRSGHSTQQVSDARADVTPIFLLPDVLALRTVPFVRPSEVPAESAIVRLETTMIEQVYPEWFGVQHEETPAPNNASANARALQACIHAACRDRVRDGVSLPPLTVKCHGIYSINETMEALPTVNGHGALWMEGIGDASTRGLGLPTIHRFPIGELAAWRNDPSRPGVATRDQTLEGEASALLRVHPRVSLEITGVGLRCHGWENGQERSVPVDVAHTILLEGRRGALTPPAQLNALDGFAPVARSWPRGVTARCDLVEAMEVALEAIRGVGPTAARAQRRVEFLHAGLERARC